MSGDKPSTSDAGSEPEARDQDPREIPSKAFVSVQGYKKLVEKGHRLVRMMKMNLEELRIERGAEGGSRFKDTSELALNGWLHARSLYEPNADVADVYRTLQPDWNSADGATHVIQYNHVQQYIVDGNMYRGTMAHYVLAINQNAGVIQANNSTSPRFKIGAPQSPSDLTRPEPDLHHWSDFAYLAWQGIPPQDPNISAAMPPRCVLRNRIFNEKTEALLNTVMREKGHPFQRNSPDTSGNIDWPGLEFTVDDASDEFLAILGTAHGAGVAYLVIDRKEEFGHLIICRVNVYIWNGNYNVAFHLHRA